MVIEVVGGRYTALCNFMSFHEFLKYDYEHSPCISTQAKSKWIKGPSIIIFNF